jgi:drug/metabolite transporter (DMT)-like permease
MTKINEKEYNKLSKQYSISIFFAILAAVLYAISAPVSKLLLNVIPPMFMASLLYLGAGIGMSVIGLCRYKIGKINTELRLTKKELPFTIGMVVLDIAAPIFLMIGLTMTTSANASLLNNFEIVATSVIAFFIFKESISKRLWYAIILITISSGILTFENISCFSFTIGSFFVLLATICWGFENNCTRMISMKDPLQIVIIKGFGSGTGSLILALLLKQTSGNIRYIIITLLLGFVSYGLSIYFYVYAQRELGAAKTSAYYAISPFIGALLSLIIFQQYPNVTFIIAIFIMMIGTYYASTDHKNRNFILEKSDRK